MSVNVKAALQTIFRNWRDDVMNGGMMNASAAIWPMVAARIPVEGSYTLFSWFFDAAMPREWLGPKKLNNASSMSWPVYTKDYELSYQFSGREIADDTTGGISRLVDGLKNSTAKWEQFLDYIVAQRLEAAASTLCYDGQNLADDAHPNDVDGVGTATTFDNYLSLALSVPNLNTALLAMKSEMRQPNGLPVVPSGPITLMVPPSLELTAKQVTYEGLASYTAANGLAAANVQNPVTLIDQVVYKVSPYLNLSGARPNAWYLLRPIGQQMPFVAAVRQDREPWMLDYDSEEYLKTGQLSFGSTMRFDIAPMEPRCILVSEP